MCFIEQAIFELIVQYHKVQVSTRNLVSIVCLQDSTHQDCCGIIIIRGMRRAHRIGNRILE